MALLRIKKLSLFSWPDQTARPLATAQEFMKTWLCEMPFCGLLKVWFLPVGLSQDVLLDLESSPRLGTCHDHPASYMRRRPLPPFPFQIVGPSHCYGPTLISIHDYWKNHSSD